MGGPLTFKVTGAETGGNLTALENVIPPGQGPPLHTHAHEDEAWYVIEGDLRFRLGDEIAVAPQGSFVFVPRGVAHCFQNVGSSNARILVLFTPSGMETFFERFTASEAPGPQAFSDAGAAVGMEIAGPPLAVSDPLPGSSA